MWRGTGLVVLVFALGACRTPVVRQVPEVAVVKPLFGPVIGPEVIAGRADVGGDVLLLTGGVELVRINLAGRRAIRASIQIAPGEQCWGLARLSSGDMFTLEGRRTLTRLDSAGRILGRTLLPVAHFGVFGVADRLIYQRADFTAPGIALRAGSPDGAQTAWSTITTRAFPTLARASAAALNMITCGATDGPERACWFPDEAAVALVADDGATRRRTLGGLETVSPEVLLTSDNPRRPIRDAYIDRRGDIWILSSGAPPPGRPIVTGGWILAKYGGDGLPKGLAHLSEAVRLILRVEAARVVVLAASGGVAEVAGW